MKSERYDFTAIEKKWRERWLADRTYEPDLDNAKKPFYNLMMFPYPSAEGLHVGNMYAFTGADIYGRMKRMQGYDVFEPMGLDGFGIHSENYALKIKAHPMKQAKVSEARFYKQLQQIGNGFAWEERLETYDPKYYRWTQWIFIQLWKHGLAYRKKQAVNWCPKDKTVLADEQVVGGKCERCEATVERRELEQWFFRITKYAGRLLKNLEKIDWSEKVKIAQRNWIGKSEGLTFPSPVKDTDMTIETFSAHFEAFTADTFVVIAPDHPLLPKLLEGTATEEKVLKFCRKIISERGEIGYEEREPKGIFTGRCTVDPVGNGELPIWVASCALASYGTGIVKCSAHDERDFAFAKKYGIQLKPTLLPPEPEKQKAVLGLETCYTDMQNGILTEPAQFVGKRAGDLREKIVQYCVERGLARPTTTYRLRDWLISRQRYWGVPIPMVFCETCAGAGKGEQKEMPGWYAVPEEELPVELPYVEDFRPHGKGESPLATAPDFYKTKCPGCGGDARRETDVSDTFLDSAWYYLRYPSTCSARAGAVPWDPAITKRWFPVNLYTGGAEHSVLHLLYVRFVALALQDMGLLYFSAKGGSASGGEEPFPKFRAHGLLISEGAKMSKSKGNVVNPDEYIKEYGADVLRMYLMFLAPFEQGGDFRDAGIQGIVRFSERVRRVFHNTPVGAREPLARVFHRTVKKVTEDIDALQYNTAIAALMVLLNEMESSGASAEVREGFLKLLAPFAPYLTEELWSRAERGNSIHRSKWPSYDETRIREETFSMVVQVNGKHRATITVPRGIAKEDAEALVRKDEKAKRALAGKRIKNVVYVENRLINFVME